jgi:hypothetical protein
VRGCEAPAACGCRTDTCAVALALRLVASVRAGADVRHMARQHKCGLGVKMALDAMPHVIIALWCSWHDGCGRAARPVLG